MYTVFRLLELEEEEFCGVDISLQSVTDEKKKRTVMKTLRCPPNNIARARAHSREARDLKLRV